MKNFFKLPKPIFRPDSFKDKERDINKLWLDKNENSHRDLNLFMKKNILNNIPPRYIFSYPSLANTYSKISNNLNVQKKQILLTAGSDGGIKTVFESMIQKKDKVLIMSPTFEMYDVYCQLYQSKYKKIDYSLSKGKFDIDLNKIINTLKTFKPKLFCFAYPDSPTGFSFKEKDVQKILNFCKKNEIFVLIDEAYYFFSKKTFIKKIKMFDNLAIVRSAGKAFALAGLRAGFIVSDEKNINYFKSYRNMYEINGIAAYMLNQIYTKNGINKIEKTVKKLEEGKNFFLKALNKNSNIEFIDTEANFIHLKILKKKNIIIKKLEKICEFKKNQRHPALKDYIRLSLTTKKNFSKILKIIDRK